MLKIANIFYKQNPPQEHIQIMSSANSIIIQHQQKRHNF